MQLKEYSSEKNKQQAISLRQIRRACHRELLRTVKKLKTHITPELMEQAEQLYLHKVVLNLSWILENGSHRKRLADWWETNVCPDIAALWQVEPAVLAHAFREAFLS